MADTLTPNYQFVQPEVGGSNDSWGNKLNAALLAIDAAIKARADAIAALATSLATTDGVADTALANAATAQAAATTAQNLATTAATAAAAATAAVNALPDYVRNGQPTPLAFGGIGQAIGSIAEFRTALGLGTAAVQNNDFFRLASETIPRSAGGTGVSVNTMAELLSAIGGVGIAASDLSATGYVRFTNGFTIQWGRLFAGLDATASVNFPVAFQSFAHPVVSPSGNRAQSGDDGVLQISSTSPPTLNGMTLVNDGPAGTHWWIAIGV